MRIEAKGGESEFGEIGLSQRHHAGRLEVRDDRRVGLLRRRVGEERRPGGGALARHVDKVLQGGRHAIERPGRASLSAPLAACLGFLQRPLAGNDDERWIAAIALDTLKEESATSTGSRSPLAMSRPIAAAERASRFSTMLQQASVQATLSVGPGRGVS